MGLAYMISAVAIFDEYTNDLLYLREGSCLPRYVSTATSITWLFSFETCSGALICMALPPVLHAWRFLHLVSNHFDRQAQIPKRRYPEL
jgi:hypothetical protein